MVEELGGEQALGRALSSERELRQAIRDGFPPAVVEELMRASGLTLKELPAHLICLLEACNAVVALEDWHVTNPTGFTAWRESSLSLMNTSAITGEPCAGSSTPIVPSAAWPRWRQSTPSWARAKWKTSWAASPMAELVDQIRRRKFSPDSRASIGLFVKALTS